MHLIIIINSIVCIVGAIVGLLFAVGSIVSIANMTVPWQDWLIVIALLIPVVFVVSAIGAWQADAQGAAQVTIGLIALPWVYAVVFVILMLVSFKY